MKKKILVTLSVIACALLLVVGSVVGTFAYLTAKTELVTNTFTVGNVQISLDESKLNDDGLTVNTAIKVLENTYHLMPGQTYEKDPTVHVLDGSENCYVFVKVVNNLSAIEDASGNTIAKQMAANGWKQLVLDGANVENVYYQENPAAAKTDLPVFSTVSIATDVDNDTLEDYNSKTVTVKAYAIQATGFDSAVEAAAELDFNA